MIYPCSAAKLFKSEPGISINFLSASSPFTDLSKVDLVDHLFQTGDMQLHFFCQPSVFKVKGYITIVVRDGYTIIL